MPLPESLLVDGQEVRSNRLLIVEDELIIAQDLVHILTDLGYVVVGTSTTGDEAVTQAHDLQPNLVLMDIRLAGVVDGIQAAARIRSERDIPIIFLTSHSDDDTLRRAKETAPVGYLIKPFRPTELRCAIEIALHKHEIDARLRTREQWLTNTLASICEGVVATDAALKVKLLNPVAQALTGWTQDEAIGKAIGDIVTLVTWGRRSPIEQALAGKSAPMVGDDTVLVSRSGDKIPIQDSAAPIVDSRGEVLGGVIVFQDVSERRRAEAHIRKLNADLERRVVERTGQLEAAKNELAVFTYAIANDLREPLRGIEGFSHTLIEDHAAHLGAEGLDQLRRLRQATLRMSQLIDELLRLSRVATCELRQQGVDLAQLANQVIADLRAADPRRSVAVAINGEHLVQGDKHLLRLVLENLLGNAWKFTAKTAAPAITCGSVDHDGKRVFYVRDNGAGFDMRFAGKLFGAFQRLHTASDFAGSGIGLAIAQRIISRHGGQIWGESMVGQGATFYIRLSDDSPGEHLATTGGRAQAP